MSRSVPSATARPGYIDAVWDCTPVQSSFERLDFVINADDKGFVKPGLMRSVINMGYSKIELNCPRVEYLPALTEQCAEEGVAIGAIATGRWMRRSLGTSPDYGAYQREALKILRKGGRIAARNNSKLILGLVRGSNTVSPRKAREFIKAAVSELNEAAPGIEILVEPITALEAAWPNSLADGAELLGIPGLENVRILADSYHIVHSREIYAAPVYGSIIGHLHIRDQHKKAPRSYSSEYGPIVYLWHKCGMRLAFELDADFETVQIEAARGIEWIRKAANKYIL